jgi:hypothetical protein
MAKARAICRCCELESVKAAAAFTIFSNTQKIGMSGVKVTGGRQVSGGKVVGSNVSETRRKVNER